MIQTSKIVRREASPPYNLVWHMHVHSDPTVFIILLLSIPPAMLSWILDRSSTISCFLESDQFSKHIKTKKAHPNGCAFSPLPCNAGFSPCFSRLSYRSVPSYWAVSWRSFTPSGVYDGKRTGEIRSVSMPASSSC